MTKTLFVSIFLVACVSMSLSSRPAQAQSNFGCACVHNKTNVTIDYTYRWGEADWRRINLQPNHTESHCWRYQSGTASSPRLQIRLDVDMSRETAWKTYDLPRAQSATNRCSAAIPNSSVFDISYQTGTQERYIIVTHR